MSKNLIERLAKIQKNLVAPKSQRNNFGKYNYRSCEDILEGLKLVLDGLVVTISDDITVIADRVYVKATVTLTDGENSITNTALAREALTKKGMDESQITGACSSYARKYALNGMFLIDDNKDADSMDNKKQTTTIKAPTSQDMDWVDAIKGNQSTLEDINDEKYRAYIKGLL